MAEDVDGYIEAAAPGQQELLRELRRLVREAAPGVTEKIAYGMPSYEIRGARLLHFAGAARHVGVYGLVHEDAEVPEELRGYLDHRSTLRFPLGRSLPADAIRAAIERKLRALP